MIKLLVILLLGCSEPKQEARPAVVPPNHFEIERPEFGDPSWATGLLGRARAALGSADAPSPVSAGGGETVLLCAYRRDAGESECARGDGATVDDATVSSAVHLREKLSWELSDVVLTLDVVIYRREGRLGVVIPDLGGRELGLLGLLAEWNGAKSFVLPSTVLMESLVQDAGVVSGVLGGKLIERLVANNAGVRGIPLGASIEFIRTAKWVERSEGAADAARIYRLHSYERPSVTPELLAERSRLAADHLVSTVAEDGRIRYLYDPRTASEGAGYNLLRHAGTTYSILQAYERFGDPRYLAAAERAISYLFEFTRSDERQGPYGGGKGLYVVEGDSIKLGGAGLALLMLVEYMDATGSREYLAQAQAFATFILSSQQVTGEFIYFASLEPGGTPSTEGSAYYPGEAILGLMRLYNLDADKRWLDTARRGANWLIDVRDAGKDAQTLANDHWLMIGLSYLVKQTGDAKFVEHSLALARAVSVQQERTNQHAAVYPDFQGGYYDPPRSTPAATRGEGLVAVLDTCALQNMDCSWVMTLLQSTESHALQSQYLDENAWWINGSAAVVGGFSGGIVDLELRNDFTQHNLSAMLGTERHLSDQGLPGGPRWRPEGSAWERSERDDIPTPELRAVSSD